MFKFIWKKNQKQRSDSWAPLLIPQKRRNLRNYSRRGHEFTCKLLDCSSSASVSVPAVTLIRIFSCEKNNSVRNKNRKHPYASLLHSSGKTNSDANTAQRTSFFLTVFSCFVVDSATNRRTIKQTVGLAISAFSSLPSKKSREKPLRTPTNCAGVRNVLLFFSREVKTSVWRCSLKQRWGIS